MSTTKNRAIAFTGIVLCSMVLLGCSDNQEKEQEQKAATKQEQIGKDTTQSMQKPIDEAPKAADAATTGASQAMKEEEEASDKKKKRVDLEGC